MKTKLKSTLRKGIILALLIVVNITFHQSLVKAEVRKGPYLIYPGSNTEMMVLWQLHTTSTCSIEWGTDTNYSDGIAETQEQGADHQHTYTISELTPGTLYYYRITDNNDYHTGSFFAGANDSEQSITFFAGGDTQRNSSKINAVWSKLLEQIEDKPEAQTFLLHAGDFTEDGSEGDWDTIFFNRNRLHTTELQSKLPIMGARGNHECYTGTQYGKYYPYPQYQSGDIMHRTGDGCYYTFTYGPVQCFSINTNESLDIGSDQYQWLKTELEKSNKAWKVVYYHAPAWGSGNHENRDDIQENIQPLLAQNNVKLVINGHNHDYTRSLVDGVNHMVMVTSCSSNARDGQVIAEWDGSKPKDELEYPHLVYYDRYNSFAKFEINNRELYAEIIRSNGSLVESFVISLDESYFPEVSITLPLENDWFYKDETITIAANATDKDGGIDRVEFYKDDELIGEDTSYPYEIAWSNLTPGNYDITAIASDNEGNQTSSNSIEIEVKDELAPLSYCEVTASDQSYEWIASVQFGDFTNPSDPTPYSDFSKQEIVVNAGDELNVILSPGYKSTTQYSETWVVWIDYNSDGDFEDDGEEVLTGSNKGAFNSSFTIPNNTLGKKRVRVAMRYNKAPELCNNFTGGEIEDYTINILNETSYLTDFSANKTTIEASQSIEFTNESEAGEESILWTFDGGNPATSTDLNPTVTYNTAGTYSVTLELTYSNGTASVSKDDYIIVTEKAINQAPQDIELSNNLVSANASTSALVGTLTAIDPDLEDSHSFEIVTNVGDATFYKIENNLLFTDKPFDFNGNLTHSITIRVTDNHGNSFSKLISIQIQTSTGINTDIANNCLIYPNPITTQLNIECAQVSEVTIYNLAGKSLIYYANTSNNSTHRLSTSTLENGIYIVKILMTDGHQIVRKIKK